MWFWYVPGGVATVFGKLDELMKTMRVRESITKRDMFVSGIENASF